MSSLSLGTLKDSGGPNIRAEKRGELEKNNDLKKKFS